MLNGRITYWLWHGYEIVGSVRGEPGMSEERVIAEAIRQHEAVPLCYPTPPLEHELKLRRARVVVYPEGR
jgi:hypothetical protein